MPYKDPAKRKALQRDWQQRNQATITSRTATRRRELTRQVQQYKLSVGCARCGYNRCAQALDIHHPSGKDGKRDGISQLCRRGVRWETIYQALEQCEVICANCHREEHADDQ